MNQAKLRFVQQFPALLNPVKPDATGLWGKMNAQQMTEHVADFFKISSGKIHMPLVSLEEHLPKLKAFLLSEKNSGKIPGRLYCPRSPSL